MVPVQVTIKHQANHLGIDHGPRALQPSHQQDAIRQVDGGRLAVMREEPYADLHVRDNHGRGTAVVVVEDLVPSPALVDGISQCPVLAHSPAVPPTPTVDHDRPVVDRVDGRGEPTGYPQLLAY